MHILFGFLTAFGCRSVFAADAGSYFNLGLKQDHYLGEGQDPSQRATYTFLSADANFEIENDSLHFKMNPVAQDALGIKGEFYFGVPELYVQQSRRIDSGFNITVGRQKRTWSHLDEEFNLGVWQPQLRWDYLEPQQEGLIAVFFDFALSHEVSLTLFTSPLFLPDQGPNYQLVDGQFSSSNRWFSQPQSRVALFSQSGISPDTPLYFQIDRPAEERIIMNSSFGLGLNYHSASGFWSAFNYAYKPQNQLHLGIECTTCLNISGPLAVTAIIHPEVIKHHVLTLESGFDGKDVNGYLSLTGDFPNTSDFPSSYAESPLDSMLIAGGAFQHYIFSWLGVPSWLKYSYVKIFDVQSRDKKGIVDSDDVHSSIDRYPYREVAAVEWKMTPLQKLKNRLDLKLRYSYSVPEQGGWLSLAANWAVGAVTWTLGSDIIGTGVDDNSPNAGLFTKYRSNDRIFGGVSYVF